MDTPDKVEELAGLPIEKLTEMLHEACVLLGRALGNKYGPFTEADWLQFWTSWHGVEEAERKRDAWIRKLSISNIESVTQKASQNAHNHTHDIVVAGAGDQMPAFLA